MRKEFKYAMFLFLFGGMVLLSFVSNAQTQSGGITEIPYTPSLDKEPCITPQQYADMAARTRDNIARLRSEDKLIPVTQGVNVITQMFNWPLTYRSNFYDNEYYFIQNYIDHNADTNNMITDYNCGTRSYDVFGYNHTGTDICIGPYWWRMMDNAWVNVIAAAGGQIVDKDDGNYDRNCGFGAGSANFVKIMHSDGSYAIYFHLVNGSVTTKAIGETVNTGEYLGLVGSSGSSTNPHLHFEPRDQSDDPVDPWAGACNPDITTSLWNNQLPYLNPGILRMATLSGAVTYPNCPTAETVPAVNHFNAGGSVRLEATIRDKVSGYSLEFLVYDPSGALIFNPGVFNVTGSFSAMSTYFYTMVLSGSAPTGTYKWVVNYQGKTAVHYFTVGCPGAYSISGSHSGYQGRISGSTITSTATISSASSNYVWYEAETYVQGNPGFRATAGCHFRARINDCTVGGTRPESPLGEEETINQFYLKASPSLVKDKTVLEFNLVQNGSLKLSVYDLAGRKIKGVLNQAMAMQGTHTAELDMEGISPGAYICILESDDVKASCKIVVQR